VLYVKKIVMFVFSYAKIFSLLVSIFLENFNYGFFVLPRDFIEND
jgi:hypothetical protein